MLRKIFSRTDERGFKKAIRFLAVVLVSFAIISVFMTNLVWSDPHSWQSILISESRFDRNHHDRNWKIEIFFEQGERYIDNEPWCGNGEKWEGYFSIHVKRDNKVLSRQSLNQLMFPHEKKPGPLSFWTPDFSLVFKDYNIDGQTDFNIGQYGSCNGNYYKIFTVKTDGVIVPVPIRDADGFFISRAKKQNSTDLIRVRNGLLNHKYYDNIAGKYFTIHYKWVDGQFIPVKKAIK